MQQPETRGNSIAGADLPEYSAAVAFRRQKNEDEKAKTSADSSGTCVASPRCSIGNLKVEKSLVLFEMCIFNYHSRRYTPFGDSRYTPLFYTEIQK